MPHVRLQPGYSEFTRTSATRHRVRVQPNIRQVFRVRGAGARAPGYPVGDVPPCSTCLTITPRNPWNTQKTIQHNTRTSFYAPLVFFQLCFCFITLHPEEIFLMGHDRTILLIPIPKSYDGHPNHDHLGPGPRVPEFSLSNVFPWSACMMINTSRHASRT